MATPFPRIDKQLGFGMQAFERRRRSCFRAEHDSAKNSFRLHTNFRQLWFLIQRKEPPPVDTADNSVDATVELGSGAPFQVVTPPMAVGKMARAFQLNELATMLERQRVLEETAGAKEGPSA
jgi:hypothetical protein